MKKIIPLIFLPLLLLPGVSLFALDFGLLLDNTFGIESVESGDLKEGIDYSGSLVSWLSTPISNNGTRFYLSGGVTAKYEKTIFSFAPEIFRAELSLPIGKRNEIKLGRMHYEDPLGFVTSGIFDGMYFSHTGKKNGTLGLGAWYTGLVYKKTARITVTDDDLAAYNAGFDFSEPSTYFASQRFLWGLEWGNPFIAEWIRLKTALWIQFDFSGGAFNSEYLMAKADIPIKNFVLNLGACLEMAEGAGTGSSSDLVFAFAGELGVEWSLPTPIQDRLMFTGRFSSGKSDNDAFGPFIPLTTKFYGYILKAKLSGLSTICLDYTARLHQSLSLDVSNTYFILSDPETYKGLPGMPGTRGGLALGDELFARLIWSPLSDLRFNLGGGVFLPALGTADKTASPMWRLELNAVIAIF